MPNKREREGYEVYIYIYTYIYTYNDIVNLAYFRATVPYDFYLCGGEALGRIGSATSGRAQTKR